MWWVVLLVVLAILVAGGLIFAFVIDAPNRQEIKELTFSSLDFDALKDGTFVGGYEGTKSHLRDTQVEVIVQDGAISTVKVLKGAIDEKGVPAKLNKGRSIDEVFDLVKQEKTLQVDVISGATLTTKTHLKALENALLESSKQ